MGPHRGRRQGAEEGSGGLENELQADWLTETKDLMNGASVCSRKLPYAH